MFILYYRSKLFYMWERKNTSKYTWICFRCKCKYYIQDNGILPTNYDQNSL